MTSQTYFGVQITSAWPTATWRPGAARPSFEKWEAWLPSGQRVAGFSLREIKAEIKEALGSGALR